MVPDSRDLLATSRHPENTLLVKPNEIYCPSKSYVFWGPKGRRRELLRLSVLCLWAAAPDNISFGGVRYVIFSEEFHLKT